MFPVMATSVVARGGSGGSSVHVKQPSTPTSPRLCSNLKSAKAVIPEEEGSPPQTPGGIQRSGRSNSDKCRTPKKLCFREPEVISHSTSSLHKIGVIAEVQGSVGDEVVVVGKKQESGGVVPSVLRNTTKSSLKSDKSKVAVDNLDDLEVGVTRDLFWFLWGLT